MGRPKLGSTKSPIHLSWNSSFLAAAKRLSSDWGMSLSSVVEIVLLAELLLTGDPFADSPEALAIEAEAARSKSERLREIHTDMLAVKSQRSISAADAVKRKANARISKRKTPKPNDGETESPDRR